MVTSVGRPAAVSFLLMSQAGDQDLDEQQYRAPQQLSELLAQVVNQDRDEPVDGLTIDPAPPGPTIVDVGCGTGLVGLALAAEGYQTIDGFDLSPAMVEVAARCGCYRTLTPGVDITQPLPQDLIGAHDIVVVGGVFTTGHVPPEALEAVASLARPGGLLIISARLQYYTDTNFGAVSETLEREGKLQLLRQTLNAPYTLDSLALSLIHI